MRQKNWKSGDEIDEMIQKRHFEYRMKKTATRLGGSFIICEQYLMEVCGADITKVSIIKFRIVGTPNWGEICLGSAI